MFKTALNNNIIPHTWKLANIVPIPKPNKDTDKGTSYRPISLLSVIAKTLEKSLLPYITANIPNTPMQHGYKTQHSTVTALHTLNNTVAKGFNQMAPPARTITVALDMSKAFDTINIHTLIRKLLQTNIPGTIIKFIANYIKGRKAYTTYRNHTSKQRQFKTGVPQGVGSSCEGDALILYRRLDLLSIPLIVRHNLVLSVYALNEFSPLSSFVVRCRFGDLIIHCRQPGRGGILFA